MEPIAKRMQESFEEVADVCDVEKKRKRTEFLTGIMGAHDHRISLFISKGKITGNTERVQGHVHKLDLSVDEQGDILGFTGISEQHKHRVKFRVKDFVKGKDKDKKKK